MKKGSIQTFFDEVVSKDFNVSKYSILVKQEADEVSYGIANDINLDYCREHNIKAFDLKRSGGAIVHFNGNVGWADIRSNRVPSTETLKDIAKEFAKDLADYLKEKNIKATIEGNDITVDGFKVASGCSINLKPDYKRTFYGFEININCDVELIKNICKKEMVKVPKGLAEYGITTEEIETFVENWFHTKGGIEND